MNKPNNVIDFKSRQQNVNRSKTKTKSNSAPVVDMTERRNEILTTERRAVRRTILSEFIGAFIVVPERGLERISIYDISETGIAFDLDLSSGAMKSGEAVCLRLYLNHQTYFPFYVNIANVRAIPEEGVWRHGCGFEKGAINDEALHHFVKFIETVSASLKTDHGDVMVSGILRR